MTVSEIVSQVYNFYKGKPLSVNSLRNYLQSNEINVNELAVLKIFDTYNRRVLDEHDEKGKTQFEEEYNSYADAKKDLDLLLSSISRSVSVKEYVELKQKINETIEKAILWSKK